MTIDSGDDIDTKWLETFTTAVRQGSFAGAAEELRYSRSTVTHQIRNLERHLGYDLFNRGASRPSLTPAGEAMIPFAESILRDVESARASLSSGSTTSLRLGATETTCAYRLPFFLRSLARAFPHLQVDVDVASAPEVRERLEHGQIQAALTTTFTDTPAVGSTRVLWAEQPILVAPSGSGARRRLLVTRTGCPYRMLADREPPAGASDAGRVDLGTVEGVKAGVSSGLGTGLVPLIAVRAHLEDGTFRRVSWTPRSEIETRVEWRESDIGPAVHEHLSGLVAV